MKADFVGGTDGLAAFDSAAGGIPIQCAPTSTDTHRILFFGFGITVKDDIIVGTPGQSGRGQKVGWYLFDLELG